LCSGLGFAVGGARRRYKVPYPLAYAPLAIDDGKVSEKSPYFAFNCYQRAHQNFLETNAEV
jgi:hypothetical protein